MLLSSIVLYGVPEGKEVLKKVNWFFEYRGMWLVLLSRLGALIESSDGL